MLYTESYVFAKFYGNFAPGSDNATQKGMRWSMLRAVIDGNVQVFQLIVSKFLYYFLEKWNARMVHGKTVHLPQLA